MDATGKAPKNYFGKPIINIKLILCENLKTDNIQILFLVVKQEKKWGVLI